VPGGNPVPRLVRMRVAYPPPGEMPQIVVQPGEDPGRDHAPVVGRPAPNHGVEVGDHRRCICPSQGTHVSGEPFPESLHRLLAWFDEQFPALAVDIAADAESEERESDLHVDDLRLVLVNGYPPGR